MPVFVSFVMGPKDGYFFNSPTHWAWRNLPPDVEALFTRQPPIRDVIEFAMGENGAWFLSWRDCDGEVYARHYNLPNPLVTYLYGSSPHIIRHLLTLSISLGPYESYYAHDRVSASWANLPVSLEKALERRLLRQDVMSADVGTTTWKECGAEAPSFVSLGAGGSYFMRTVRGGGSWEIKGQGEGVRGVNKFLEGVGDFSGVAGLYLFPYHPQSYILLLTSGKAFSNLPEHTWDDYSKMAPTLPQMVQTMAPIPCVPQMQGQLQPQIVPGQQQTGVVGAGNGIPSPFVGRTAGSFHSQMQQQQTLTAQPTPAVNQATNASWNSGAGYAGQGMVSSTGTGTGTGNG